MSLFYLLYLSMIRRIIWLLIILWLAYSIYRWIDPVGAEELVTRIQSYFDKEESQEIIEQEQEEPVIEPESPEQTTTPIYTGTLDTGSLVELEYVLSWSVQTWSVQDDIVITPTTSSSSTTSSPSTSTSTSSSPTPSTQTSKPTSKKSLSQQDEADMKAFLNAIVE